MMLTPPLSLYIHLPWCVAKCPYCDFNSYATAAHPMDENAYVAALLQDFRETYASIPNRNLVSIFIGGGTPSLFSAQSIDTLLQGIHAQCAFDKNIEITLEANPGTFEREKFADFVKAGINRISLGVQSFNDAHLKVLGRIHSSDEARLALEHMQSLSLKSFNVDLMYGLPNQTLAQSQADIQEALRYAPKHLSWYHLTLEPNTAFYRMPPKNLPEEDALYAIEEAGRAQLADAGLHAYEISAYAQAGFESVHNRNYWTFGDYIGIGAGAHGKLSDPATNRIVRTCKQRVPRNYLNPAIPFTSNETPIEPDARAFEFMMNALRLTHGVPMAYFTERTGMPFSSIEAPLREGCEKGLLTLEDDRIRTTELGARFLNDVVNLFHDLSQE